MVQRFGRTQSDMSDRGKEIDNKQKSSVITAGSEPEAASAKERQDKPPGVQGKSLSAILRMSQWKKRTQLYRLAS